MAMACLLLNLHISLYNLHGEYNMRCIFLAAISISRSGVVTQCVRPFVCLFSFRLVSLEFYPVLKSFNVVSRKLKGCLKFTGGFKEVLRMFQGSFKGAYYRKF